MTNREIRKKAYTIFKSHLKYLLGWVLVRTLFVAVSFLLALLLCESPPVMQILVVLLSIPVFPMVLGMTKLTLGLWCGNQPRFSYIFEIYRDKEVLVKSLRLGAVYYIIVSLAPVLYSHITDAPEAARLSAVFLETVIESFLAPTLYLFAASKSIGVLGLLKKSYDLMLPHIWKYLIFLISTYCVVALSFLAFGLVAVAFSMIYYPLGMLFLIPPFLLVEPYMNVAIAGFMRHRVLGGEESTTPFH